MDRCEQDADPFVGTKKLKIFTYQVLLQLFVVGDDAIVDDNKL